MRDELYILIKLHVEMAGLVKVVNHQVVWRDLSLTRRN